MTTRPLDYQVFSSNPQSPSGAPKLRGIWRKCVRLGARFIGLLFILSLVITMIYAVVPVPATPLMVIRAGQKLIAGQSPKWEKDWVSLDQISPRLQYAVIAAEDFRFFEHSGFDWIAIEKAIKYNRRHQKVRGASTITQQVAKNVFLWPSRSWTRKSLEVYFTALIELFWSKERIIEVYLNVVELGDGVYGVEAAAQRYFKKPAVKLSSSEAALIAAVLPNPHHYRISRPSRYVRFRQTMIQRRMPAAARLIPDP